VTAEPDTVDEIRLWTMPVEIGAGQWILEDVDPAAARLDLTGVHRFANGSVILTYSPRHTPRVGRCRLIGRSDP
jgi:hypothetical protein